VQPIDAAVARANTTIFQLGKCFHHAARQLTRAKERQIRRLRPLSDDEAFRSVRRCGNLTAKQTYGRHTITYSTVADDPPVKSAAHSVCRPFLQKGADA
jgi:hypothetical protein